MIPNNLPQKTSYILSISAGHDASASVFHEGKPISCVHGERINRVRHQFGIDKQTIKMALSDAGISEADISYIALTFTQLMPSIIWDTDYLNVISNKKNIGETHGLLCSDNPYHDTSRTQNPIVSEFESVFYHFQIDELISGSRDPINTAEFIFANRKNSYPRSWFDEKKWKVLEILSPKFNVPNWLTKTNFENTSKECLNGIDNFDANHRDMKMFLECEFDFCGKPTPGIILDHHFAHQASSYYTSDQAPALIFSCDGGTGIDAGFISIGYNGSIYPIFPHFLELGQIYDFFAAKLGLGDLGGAGKLMGLSSYGIKEVSKLQFPSYTKNINDIKFDCRVAVSNNEAQIDAYEFIFQKFCQRIEELGINTDMVGNKDRILEDAPIIIAASIQLYVENTFVEFLCRLKKNKAFDFSKMNLCLSGGFALNCPTNSKIYNTKIFKNIHIEPHCEDGGLVLGAGYYLSNIINQKSTPLRKSSDAYLGSYNANHFEPSQLSFYQKILYKITKVKQIEDSIASDLSKDKVIAVCVDKSETGPRALGSRSILANARPKSNWRRVNEIKNREQWRPFAPVVLENKLSNFFENGPDSSPFMLFTYKVIEKHKEYGEAITHVDGTARVQTVKKTEFLGKVLDCCDKYDIPIIMNTSFNGPGEPIIETAGHALNFFSKNSLDVLYVGQYKFEKRFSIFD